MVVRQSSHPVIKKAQKIGSLLNFWPPKRTGIDYPKTHKIWFAFTFSSTSSKNQSCVQVGRRGSERTKLGVSLFSPGVCEASFISEKKCSVYTQIGSSKKWGSFIQKSRMTFFGAAKVGRRKRKFPPLPRVCNLTQDV